MATSFAPGDALEWRAGASLVPVVDEEDRGVGLAAVVRATYDRLVLLLHVGAQADPGELYLALGDERVPTSARAVGPLLVLEGARSGRDLFAAHPASRPASGEFLFVYGVTPAGVVRQGVTSVDAVEEGSVYLLEDPDVGVDLLGAAVVLSPDGALVGFVSGRDGDRPQVTPLELVAKRLLDAVLAPPGAELFGPEDGFLTYEVNLPQALDEDAVPPVEDAWGAPDYFLLLEREERQLVRMEVTPQRGPAGPDLLWSPARHGLTARLVERDLTLTQGESFQDLTLPEQLELPGRRAGAFDLPLELIGATDAGPAVTRVVLDVEEIDPDRGSGGDATPLGATPHGLGRVGTGTLDWHGGDATDLWAVDMEEGGRMVCLLFREHPSLDLELEGFAPGSATPALRGAPARGELLRLVVGSVPPGRVLVRVRQRGGPPGQVGYALCVFPLAESPRALVRALFRLVARQPVRSRRALGTVEFAREVKVAFSSPEAGFDPETLTDAFLHSLGDRTAAARHLVLHLLQSHYRPSLAALEQARRESRTPAVSGAGPRVDSARARDAALLLAQRTSSVSAYLPVLAAAEGVPPEALVPSAATYDGVLVARLLADAQRILREAILTAARDANDPRIRLRALAAASRWRDPALKAQLKRELRQLLIRDPSPMITRALERAFPAALEERQRRLRQQVPR